MEIQKFKFRTKMQKYSTNTITQNIKHNDWKDQTSG